MEFNTTTRVIAVKAIAATRPAKTAGALCAATVVAALLALSSRPAQAQSPISASYEASLGTSPQAQGWTIIDNVGSPAPTVSGGFLNQGPTTNSESQYWQSTINSNPAFDFNQGFVLTARLNVVSSSYVETGGIRRSGYYYIFSDTLGRYYQFGIASDRVFFDNTSSAPTGGPAYTLVNTTGFHDYRVVVDSSGARAFFDGASIALTSAALGPTGVYTPNVVQFGDVSILAASQTQTQFVRYTAGATTTAPEPASAALTASFTAFLSLDLIKRRRRLIP